MPIANCGVQYSWDTPLWCDPKGDEKCNNCPLNKKYKKE